MQHGCILFLHCSQRRLPSWTGSKIHVKHVEHFTLVDSLSVWVLLVQNLSTTIVIDGGTLQMRWAVLLLLALPSWAKKNRIMLCVFIASLLSCFNRGELYLHLCLSFIGIFLTRNYVKTITLHHYTIVVPLEICILHLLPTHFTQCCDLDNLVCIIQLACFLSADVADTRRLDLISFSNLLPHLAGTTSTVTCNLDLCDVPHWAQVLWGPIHVSHCR